MDGSVAISSTSSRPPITPRTNRIRNDYNVKLRSISLEFDLPLKHEPRLLSPSERLRRSEDDASKCERHIHFLFYRNIKALDHVLQQLRLDVKENRVKGSMSSHMLDLIADPVKLEKERPSATISAVKNFTPMLLKSPPETESLARRSPRQVRSAQKSNPKALRQSLLKWPSSKKTETHVFALPDKPKKRPSSEALPPPTKHLKGDHHSRWSSWSNAASGSDSFNTSSASTFPSARPSFSTNQPSFADTVATSIDHGDLHHCSSPSAYSDLDLSQTEMLMTGYDQSPVQSDMLGTGLQMLSASRIGQPISPSQETIPDSEPVNDRHPINDGAGQVMGLSGSGRAMPTTQRLRSLLSDNRLDTRGSSLPSKTTGKTTSSSSCKRKEAAKCFSCSDTCKRSGTPEHRLIRDLPNRGLFARLMPTQLHSHPFALRWEALRMSETLSISLEHLFGQVVTSELDLYDLLDGQTQSFHKSSAAAFETSRHSNSSSTVSYKANLAFTRFGPSRDDLFFLNMQPLSCEIGTRLNRAFGSHRFLYVDLPSTLKLPPDLGKQSCYLGQRLREWLGREKDFLGCVWRPFHIQPIKQQLKKKQKGNFGGHRVVLFATHGHGLESISLNRFLDWIVPMRENGHQSFCKAYARLDLSLSQTIPTIRFKTSQIRFRPDTKADGSREDAQFNDPCFSFPASHNPFAPKVMNDGCALISIGAAKTICLALGWTDVRPAAFQGRINGCKGMWFISAPYDTTDPAHKDVWIEIGKSQRKVEPRQEDLDNSSCPEDRWTFELVKCSGPPCVSNLYLDFLPILQDRHISQDIICTIVKDQLDLDFEGLFNSLDSSPRLRSWIHSQAAMLEEQNRAAGIEMSGSFPLSNAERIIMLLESGFQVKTCLQLASCLQQFVKTWIRCLQDKLRIRLPRSTSAYGIADPTGCLAPGEIYLSFSKHFDDDTTGETWSCLRGEVLVARNPALRRSDIQKVTAVYKDELSHLKDVVVFPTRGRQPLADKLQGGDYDGDTFWLTWDHRLTGPFLNAPAPTAEPSCSFVKADGRKLKDVLGPDQDVDAWLAQSFEFRLQEDLLGQVTKLYQKLAYKENDLGHAAVVALADLHDIIIDSAKNGRTFTADAFKAFKLQHRIKEPQKPAYEESLSADNNKSPKTRKPRYNPNHIIDKVLFEVVKPRIDAMQKQLASILKPAQADDEDLTCLYREHKASNDPTVVAVLQNLMRDFRPIVSRWNETMNRATFADSNPQTEAFQQATLKCKMACYTLFRAIKPSVLVCNVAQEQAREQWPEGGGGEEGQHPLIAAWLSPRLPHEPSTWDLLKASAFYHERHARVLGAGKRQDRSPLLAFFVAGTELCYLKARSTSDTRTVVADLFAVYRPKAPKERGVRRLGRGVVVLTKGTPGYGGGGGGGGVGVDVVGGAEAGVDDVDDDDDDDDDEFGDDDGLFE